MFGLFSVLYFLFFGRRINKHNSTNPIYNQVPAICDVGVQTEENDILGNDTQNRSSSTTQSVGNVVQMVNCSAEDSNTSENTKEHLEITVNISQGNHEPGAADNINATSKNLQSVGSVVQIVGELNKLTSSNTDVLGNRLQPTGDKTWTGLRNPGHNAEVTANGDGQTVVNLLQVGSPLNDDRTVSQVSDNRLPEIKANAGEGAKQTVVNSIQSRDHMEIESLKKRIKVLENNVLELWELARRPRLGITEQQNQQIDNNSEEGFLDTTESDGNATDIKSKCDQGKETQLETLIHDVVSSCSELREDLRSNKVDMNYELQNIFSRLDNLESRMEDVDPENVGTYRVTDEDIQGMFQEFENSLYK